MKATLFEQTKLPPARCPGTLYGFRARKRIIFDYFSRESRSDFQQQTRRSSRYFEEAAGVLKYKQRKKKAEQKLFETEDNLNRLQDIIYELEDQLIPLAAQSEAAKQFCH